MVTVSPGKIICLDFEIKQVFVLLCGVENTGHVELLNRKFLSSPLYGQRIKFCKQGLALTHRNAIHDVEALIHHRIEKLIIYLSSYPY